MHRQPIRQVGPGSFRQPQPWIIQQPCVLPSSSSFFLSSVGAGCYAYRSIGHAVLRPHRARLMLHRKLACLRGFQANAHLYAVTCLQSVQRFDNLATAHEPQRPRACTKFSNLRSAGR
jgi:hypothetical protein